MHSHHEGLTNQTCTISTCLMFLGGDGVSMPQCIVESRDVGEEKLNIVTACCASLQKGLGWHWVGHFQWWFCWGGGGGLEGQKPPPPPPQTCSATPPGIMLGRYKISLMSSYLELGHTCATCKARWRGRRVYIVSSSDQLSRIRISTDSDCTRTHLRGPTI